MATCAMVWDKQSLYLPSSVNVLNPFPMHVYIDMKDLKYIIMNYSKHNMGTYKEKQQGKRRILLNLKPCPKKLHLSFFLSFKCMFVYPFKPTSSKPNYLTPFPLSTYINMKRKLIILRSNINYWEPYGNTREKKKGRGRKSSR